MRLNQDLRLERSRGGRQTPKALRAGWAWGGSAGKGQGPSPPPPPRSQGAAPADSAPAARGRESRQQWWRREEEGGGAGTCTPEPKRAAPEPRELTSGTRLLRRHVGRGQLPDRPAPAPLLPSRAPGAPTLRSKLGGDDGKVGERAGPRRSPCRRCPEPSLGDRVTLALCFPDPWRKAAEGKRSYTRGGPNLPRTDLNLQVACCLPGHRSFREIGAAHLGMPVAACIM